MNIEVKNEKTSAIIICIIAALCIFSLSKQFKSMLVEEPIYPGKGVSEVKMLSDYFEDIKGTPGDTEVYVLKGEKPGGSILVLGGTHPNEPSGYVSAILLIENAVPEQGTMFVVPRTNNSGFTHDDPQEGSPMRFTIDTPSGERWFRFGSRATNPIHQWPDPDIYVHKSSGQKLSGSETRNINRTYPGRADGSFTEKVSYAITEMIKQENIDITVDLHEASPEYPTINAIVAHEKAMPLASQALINMQIEGINISLEPSPSNLRGLTHRELGDHTDTLALLMETANPSQGRLRGKTNSDLVVNGKDKFYVRAAEHGRLYVPFDENGHPLSERVARHITGIKEFYTVFGEQNPDKSIDIKGIPNYEDMINHGLGEYLQPR